MLAQQLSTLTLTFDDQLISNLNSVSKCTAIEGVNVSDEQLGAIREAAKAQADEDQDLNDVKEDLKGFGGSGIEIGNSQLGNNKKKDLGLAQ